MKITEKNQEFILKNSSRYSCIKFELTVTYHKAVIDKEFLFYVTPAILIGGRSMKGDNLRQDWLNLVQ